MASVSQIHELANEAAQDQRTHVIHMNDIAENSRTQYARGIGVLVGALARNNPQLLRPASCQEAATALSLSVDAL